MNDVIPQVKIAGRRFKPVAFGVMVTMFGLAVAGVFRLGTFDGYNAFLLTMQVSAAIFAVVLFAIGWLLDNEKWAEWGLIVSVFAYLERAIYLTIEDTLGDSVTLAYGALLIIAGSYVLEASDNRKDGH